MKKIARWALAFASVMSVSASAMAMPEGLAYSVCVLNGPTEINIGRAVFTYMAQVPTPEGGICQYMGQWCNSGSLLLSCVNSYLEQELTLTNMSCSDNSMWPVDAAVQLDRHVPIHWGINKFNQKAQVYKLKLVLDGIDASMKGVISWHPMAMAMGIKYKPNTTPWPVGP